ncbi:NAD(P)-dependent oxidoreductase [Panacibacter sp. DH6]|uniref:NAD(P)-dependent oxidoreductase n=1 Tax=Panacibacter microcysteis TaxID=2793269 RepID=A0A931GVB6_9BACT|nr:NAD(P)-dependent oxidoreductase [Panacibacter microcysteis]MBG9377636.1 NAD(P)-dependent oxidoreductase [Panacibacter microcysteis]
MQIGFIGLGNLGTPIAENILEQHNQLFVFNRTAAKAQPLVNKGAVLCATVKELAQQCDVIFTMVSDDAALNHITKSEDGLAANMKEGAIHISMSTILPATAIYLDSLHHVHRNIYVAAPVMGRPEAARAKKLNFLVSGKPVTVETITPLLTAAGAAGVWNIGTATEAANVAKLCSNFLIIAAIEAMAEGINLAQKSGIDATAWMNMITSTLFASPIYKNYGNILLQQAYEPAAFSLKLGLKDVNLINEQAAEKNTEMPLGGVLQQQLQECVNKGFGEHDWTAIALALK